MLTINDNDSARPRCQFTSLALPTFVNHDQPPTKKKPFSAILRHHFAHTLDILVTQDVAADLHREVSRQHLDAVQFARVHMKLGDIISGEFFNQYIKTGNIVMISAGKPGVDHIFTLVEGVLRCEVDKATYERLGLQGSAIPSGGRKHMPLRFAIDIDLRTPSMVRGRNGFERLCWACKNVLNHNITWLFYDKKNPNLNGPAAGAEPPILAFQPQVRTLTPSTAILEGVHVPGFPLQLQKKDDEEAAELLEWLTLATSLSPRIQSADTIDPYLSRYRTPDWEEDLQDEKSPPARHDLVRIRWHGLISTEMMLKLFLATLKSAGTDGWAALDVSYILDDSQTFLVANSRCLMWEYHD